MQVKVGTFARAILLAAAALTISVGCDEKKSESKSPAAAAAPAGDVLAVLAKADAADGKTDKIVAKCAGCALNMEGKPENELEVRGYKLHFCSKGCKEEFARDPEKTLLAKLPG